MVGFVIFVKYSLCEVNSFFLLRHRIRDKLDTKIDKKLGTAKEEWLGSVKADNEATAIKLNTEFTSKFEEGREKWQEKLRENERENAMLIERLKDDFAKNVTELKGIYPTTLDFCADLVVLHIQPVF